MNTSQSSQQHFKSNDVEDDDDDIDVMVATKSTGGSGNSKNYVLSNTIMNSPRHNLYELDFNQNSVSESQKKARSLKHSLRSLKDSKTQQGKTFYYISLLKTSIMIDVRISQ
jgi:hypothetical protein